MGYLYPLHRFRVQRRMHPSIADLTRNTIYHHVEDHGSVSDYPEVVGMKNRLFWLDHDYQEESKAEQANMSKSNPYEVNMVVALVTHLLRQGAHAPDEIAVLTPYLGQMQNLRRTLGASFEILIGDRDVEELERQGLDIGNVSSSVTTWRRTRILNAIRVATVEQVSRRRSQRHRLVIRRKQRSRQMRIS